MKDSTKRFTVRVLTPTLFLILSGCGSTELQKFIEERDYVPFVVPRDSLGVGTMIDFQAGVESLVDSGDTGICLTEKNGVKWYDTKAGLETTEYEITRDNKLELNLGKILGDEVKVEGAFRDARVKKVRIELVEPFERRIAKIDVKQFLGTIDDSSPCYTFLRDRELGVFVIHSVLGANAIRYQFLSDTSTALTLDAKVLEEMDIRGETNRKYVGKDSLSVDFPILIGYRAWEAYQLPGAARTMFGVRELTASQLTALRAARE